MITIFRRIRKKLMTSGSITKYLLYALGEILLVVVGILIALQVNNWNELRKLQNEEQYLLQELQREFQTNLDLVQRDFRGNKRTSDAVLHILDLFDNPQPDTQQLLDSLIVTVFTTTSYDPATGVVDEIISTGRLNVLNDDSLRYLISQWPSVIRDQHEDIQIRWNHFEQFVLPAIIKSYPIKSSNQYFDFSFWTDQYQRIELPPSSFSFNPDEFFTSEMEGLLYVHSLNQDFILMNDIETQSYLERMLDRIQSNIE